MELHATHGQSSADVFNKRISDDDLAGAYRVLPLLLLAICTTGRVTTNGTGWGAEVEDTSDLGWCVSEVEGPIVPLGDVSKENSNDERLAAEGKSEATESVMKDQNSHRKRLTVRS